MQVPERASGVFAMVTRDESWTLTPRLSPLEQRLSHGIAITGEEIVASDERDEELLALVDEDMTVAVSALDSLPAGDTAVRVVVSARRAGAAVTRESVIIVSTGPFSIVTSPAALVADVSALLRIAAVLPEVDADPRSLPIVWRHGSGAVLLHEAAGHPAEHGKGTTRWPSWLSIRDEPSFQADDTGRAPRPADLAAGEAPSARRRASFADVPLRRLSNIVVDHRAAPMTLPSRRIEVLLVAGGLYDPLSGLARLFVSAADVIEGSKRWRARPFMIEASPEEVAQSLRGAAGKPERYPGVVCSSEGQEIVVGSHAPLLVTSF